MKYKKNSIRQAAAALCAIILGTTLVGQAGAQSFGIHFLGNTTASVTGTAGVVPIANWNNLASSYTSGTILASDGTTAATLVLSGAIPGDGGWNSGAPNDGANGSLMDGYLDLGANISTHSVTNTISGLTGAHYNVYIYMYGDASHPGNGGDWLPNYSVNGTPYYAPQLGNGNTTYDSTGAALGGAFAGFVQATAYLANFSTAPAAAAFGNYLEVVNVSPVGGVITVVGEANS
jgi:hypothetical protein